MPLSPLLERFTLDDEGVPRRVAAIASERIGLRDIVLVVPDDALETEGDDMEAWICERVMVDGEPALRDLDDDDAIDAAWAAFEDKLSLGIDEEPS
jgi:hypothetical protein